MKNQTCSVRVIGSVERLPGVVEENMVLRVEEGFRSVSEATKWGKKFVKETPLARKFKVEPAY